MSKRQLNEQKFICDYLDDLKKMSSTNAKVNLLKEFLKNKYFRWVVRLALTDTYSFNIKKLPKPSADLFSNKKYTLVQVMYALENYSKKQGLSNEEKSNFANMLTDDYLWRIANLIVNKKLDCGVSAKLINKARPGTVKVMPYMRCRDSKDIHRIEYPAILDIKADGMFLNLIIDKSSYSWRTRNGLLFNLQSKRMEKALKRIFGKNYQVVCTGEARIVENGRYLPRKTGNGLLNSILKGTAPQEIHDTVCYSMWDIIPLEEFWNGYYDMPLEARRWDLRELDMLAPEIPIDYIESVEVNSLEEAQEVTDNWMSLGIEGGVLKNKKGVWKSTDTGSPDTIKIKAVKECELRIVGWEYGKGKYKKCMGSVNCESECSNLKVNVSGWRDEERLWDWDEHIGKIITVKFNESIAKKKGEDLSLFLPRVKREKDVEFVEFRYDKDKANTLKEILEL